MKHEHTAYILSRSNNDELEYLNRFWDVSTQIWTQDFNQTELFKTPKEAEKARASVSRDGSYTQISRVTIRLDLLQGQSNGS